MAFCYVCLKPAFGTRNDKLPYPLFAVGTCKLLPFILDEIVMLYCFGLKNEENLSFCCFCSRNYEDVNVLLFVPK